MMLLSIVGSILVAVAAIFLVTLLVCRPFWRKKVIEDAQRLLAAERALAAYRRMVCPICWIVELTNRTQCPVHDLPLIPMEEIERLHLPLPTVLTARDRPRDPVVMVDQVRADRRATLHALQPRRLQ